MIREATNDNINDEIKKSGFNSKSWRIINDSDLIPDRTFRNAWKDVNNKIEVDMPKAREIHRNNLRIARIEMLNTLDVEYIRADEQNNITRKNEIISQKQLLRDITKHPSIENAKTPEELKNIWFDTI